MPAKSLFTSKTFWVAVIAFVAGMAEMIVQGSVTTEGVVVLVMAALQVVLRLLTTGPVAQGKQAPAAPAATPANIQPPVI